MPREAAGKARGRECQEEEKGCESEDDELLSFWTALGACPTVLRWISQGYDIPFLRGGGEPPPWEQHNRKGAEEYAFFLEETLPELVRVGAVRPVAERPHGVSPLNVVPKSTEGKYRLILDLRFLNEHLAEFTFTMETLSRRRHGFERNDWIFNLDLQSGYFP